VKVALIFPPAMHPTGPPLGISLLKSFLGERNPHCSVRLWDLNLAYYQKAMEWVRKEKLRIRLKGLDSAATAARVTEACDLFRGRAGIHAFLDLPRYNAAADVYRRFEMVLNGLLETFSRRILVGGRVPPLAEQFFHELIEPIERDSPDLLGFSVLFSQQVHFTLLLAKLLKKPSNRVVLGGATFSVMPEPRRLLGDSVSICLDSRSRGAIPVSFVDSLVLGEGEWGLQGLTLDRDPDLSRVPGLVYRRDGQILSNPGRGTDNLNELPLPDFGDFPLDEYHSPVPVLPYLSSRGCYWNRCAFCTHSKTYFSYREESPEKTAESLEALKDRWGVHCFGLVDEMIHPGRFRRLSRRVLERELDIFYSAYAKPTGGFAPGLLDTLARSGLRVMMWGVESGSQRVLDLMQKGVRKERMEKALRDSHAAGIRNLVFLMFGFPTESREEWEQTVEFVAAHRECIDAVSKSRFVLLAGSRILRDPSSFGIVRILDRPRRDPVSVAYDYEVSRGLSGEEADRAYANLSSVPGMDGRSPFFGIFRDHFLLHAIGPDALEKAGLPAPGRLRDAAAAPVID